MGFILLQKLLCLAAIFNPSCLFCPLLCHTLQKYSADVQFFCLFTTSSNVSLALCSCFALYCIDWLWHCADCSWSWALCSHGILSLVAVATCPVPVVALGTVLPQTPTQYLEYVTVTCDLLGVNPKQLQSRCMWDEATLSYAVDTTLLRCDIAGTTHTSLWLDFFFPWGEWGVN